MELRTAISGSYLVRDLQTLLFYILPTFSLTFKCCSKSFRSDVKILRFCEFPFLNILQGNIWNCRLGLKMVMERGIILKDNTAFAVPPTHAKIILFRVLFFT